jgi:Domain of unknown function (DUF4292)
MKKLVYIFLLVMLGAFVFSCKTTKQINKVIAPKDSSLTKITSQSAADSLAMINNTMINFRKNHVDFKTFNAKIKVEYQNNKGKQPDITAIVRIIKDSAIWMSLTATFLNIEVYRILITKDSVILLNKQDREVQYRSLDYLQEVTQIPFDYNTLQDLLVGNPVFMGNNISSYRKTESQVLLSVTGKIFKHLLTLSSDSYLLQHSKLDDIDLNRNRTADITYSGFENKNGIMFSTYREITVSEKDKLDIQLTFKQYEFNKELSVFFNVPKNYKRT